MLNLLACCLRSKLSPFCTFLHRLMGAYWYSFNCIFTSFGVWTQISTSFITSSFCGTSLQTFFITVLQSVSTFLGALTMPPKFDLECYEHLEAKQFTRGPWCTDLQTSTSLSSHSSLYVIQSLTTFSSKVQDSVNSILHLVQVMLSLSTLHCSCTSLGLAILRVLRTPNTPYSYSLDQKK